MSKMNKRSILSVTLSDGAGTPLTLALKYWGELSFTNGGYALSNLTDEAGDFADVGPTRGDAQESTISLNNLQLISKGDQASISILDIINQTGVYASTWVSTTDPSGNCDNAEKTLNLAVSVDDCSGTAAKVYYWERVTIDPATVTFNAEGALTSLTLRSRQPYPSTTAP